MQFQISHPEASYAFPSWKILYLILGFFFSCHTNLDMSFGYYINGISFVKIDIVWNKKHHSSQNNFYGIFLKGLCLHVQAFPLNSQPFYSWENPRTSILWSHKKQQSEVQVGNFLVFPLCGKTTLARNHHIVCFITIKLKGLPFSPRYLNYIVRNWLDRIQFSPTWWVASILIISSKHVLGSRSQLNQSECLCRDYAG